MGTRVRKLTVVIIFLIVSLGMSQDALAEQQWLLMARHGECFAVETLKRKVPDLGDTRDPDSFIAFMREQGYEVISREMPVPQGKAVEIKVPKLELFLIFVTPEICRRSEEK